MGALVEEFAEPPAATSAILSVVVVVSALGSMFGPMSVISRRIWCRLLSGGRRSCQRAFDDLVEFTAVEPYSTALGTVVDLDSGAI